jgi:hypothetical protein
MLQPATNRATIHNVNTLHPGNFTWLGRAVVDNNLTSVTELLSVTRANCNVNGEVYDDERRIFRWETPLITAARLGYFDIVRVLVAHGASLDVRDMSTGRSALHWACTRKHDVIVRHLIQVGSPVNNTNIDGETPIVEAIIYRNIDLVYLFLDSGIFLDLPINYDRDTVLLLATHIGFYEATEAFLKAGSCVKWFNQDHEDVLQILLRDFSTKVFTTNHGKLLQMVLFSGAKINHIHWNICRQTNGNFNGGHIIEAFSKNPISLMGLCRRRTRRSVLTVNRHRPITGCVELLPIPTYMKNYLKYDVL